MITGDSKLIELLATVRYRISEPRVYLFEVGDPRSDPAGRCRVGAARSGRGPAIPRIAHVAARRPDARCADAPGPALPAARPARTRHSSRRSGGPRSASAAGRGSLLLRSGSGDGGARSREKPDLCGGAVSGARSGSVGPVSGRSGEGRWTAHPVQDGGRGAGVSDGAAGRGGANRTGPARRRRRAMFSWLAKARAPS